MTREKVLAKGTGKSPFSEYLGQCTGNFKVSNAWTHVWNKMTEKKVGSRNRIPRER